MKFYKIFWMKKLRKSSTISIVSRWCQFSNCRSVVSIWHSNAYFNDSISWSCQQRSPINHEGVGQSQRKKLLGVECSRYQSELNGHRQSCPQTTVVCTLSADTLHTRTTLKFETADTSQTQTYYHFKNADTEQTQTFKYFKSEDTQQTQTHISSD